MKKYNPKDIEPKWQRYWDENSTYAASDSSEKQKIYATPMLPYPSGAGLHTGHVRNYSITDAVARFHRQRGFNVMTTMAWDSFGLPAENYAIKTGTPPAESTKKNVEYFKKQLLTMGMSYDWSREFDTSDPEYYRWTQWVFSLMYERGLAYKAKKMQWWCEKCNTVLADEQVIAGKCWRHDGDDDPLVKKRPLSQWFFKTTEYADELLESTDDLNWPEKIKTMQKNWIGKKSGIEIIYRIEDVEGEDENVICFTTRPDTNFGATFIVLAPEHALAQRVASGDVSLKKGAINTDEVSKYTEKALKKSELERQKEGRTKTGVFTGLYAHNGLNGRKMPIWVSDFVLSGFGTGAVVGVPGHDLRDFQFAQKFDLPIERVVVSADGDESPITTEEQVQEDQGHMVNSEFLNGLGIHEATEKMMDHMVEHGMGVKVVNYRIRDWLISRQRYWGAPVPIVYCDEHGEVLVPTDQLPVKLPEVKNYVPDGKNSSVLAGVEDWVNTTCPKCDKPAKRETDTMDGYVCSTWYLHRYTDPKNDKQAFDPKLANYWFPIDFYFGADHAVAHLLYVRFFQKVLADAGLAKGREPVKRLVYNGYVYAEDGRKMSKSLGNTVDPMDIVKSGYGADALRVYELFIAPYDQDTLWNQNGVPATYRFINRLWTLAQEYLERKSGSQSDEVNEQLLKAAHKTIKKVSDDLENMKLNTPISSMMECVNELYKLKELDGYGSDGWQFALESIVQLLAPFAPHVAEELWRDLGHDDSVHIDHWPAYDEKYLVQETMTLAIQVNGKVRAEIEVSVDADEESIKQEALDQENVQNHLAGKEPKKVIYVKNRLVSVVA